MSKSLLPIDPHELGVVVGGVIRAAGASSSDQSLQLQLMMSQIGDSIKSLAASDQNSSSSMLMPMMMMMLMGSGGGIASAATPAPASTSSAATTSQDGTVIRVRVQ